ncbi:MAG: hypothetical protein JOZ75_14955 [Candidatus Dormibacteraeota bacterium]|nr:hypothetical protein [Candidatus Dormibacteraeota bacterium]
MTEWLEQRPPRLHSSTVNRLAAAVTSLVNTDAGRDGAPADATTAG